MKAKKKIETTKFKPFTVQKFCISRKQSSLTSLKKN